MEAEAVTQSRLIGAILVENGLITRDQLLLALELQGKTGERLGEIVVAEFNVPRIELASVLAEQWAALEGNPSGERITLAPAGCVVAAPAQGDPAIRRPIGEIFLEFGFITQAQLDAALDVQRTTGGRVGEILVEQGSLTRLDLASALAEQWSSLEKLRPPSPDVSDIPVSLLRDTSAPRDVSAVDSSALSALKGRLAALESTPTDDAAPGVAESEAGIVELRNALASLDMKIDEVSGTRSAADEIAGVAAGLGARIDALEQHDVSGELAMLRNELEEVMSRPDATEAMAGLRAAIGRLEERPDASLQIEALAAEIAVLSARLDDRTAIGELETMVEAVAEQAETAGSEVRHLSERLETLSSLGERLDELAARVPAEGAIDSLVEQFRRDLAEIEVGQVTSLEPDGTAAIDSLAARVEQLAIRLDALGTRSVESGHLEVVQSRLDELDGFVARVSAAQPLEDLHARVTALALQGDAIASVEGRLGELEVRIDAVGSAAELRQEIQRVAEHMADERVSLTEALMSRVEEMTAASTRPDELAELRERLDQLAAQPTEVGDLEIALESLRIQTDETRAELERALAEGTEPLGLRLEEAESRIEALAEAESRQGALAAELERLGQDGAALTHAVAKLRTELEAAAAGTSSAAERVVSELAEHLEDDSLHQRVDELGVRLEAADALGASILDVREALAGLDSVRVADALATGARLAGVEAALASLEGREANADTTADLRAELEALVDRISRDETGDRLAELTGRIDRVSDEARLAAEQECRDHTDEAVAPIWSALQEYRIALEAQLGTQSAEIVALRAHLAEMRESSAAQAGVEGRLEARIAAEAAAARAVVERELAEARAETASLGARIDELIGLRHTDLQAARFVDDRLVEEIEALTARLEDEREAARSRTADLSTRLEGLAGAVSADAAAAAELAGAELAARLDDLAVRSAASAAELETALRGDLHALAARFEEIDGANIEAREELLRELERLASSMGWRLERIEESLAGDDSEALRTTVAELERRLDGQSALGEEQARATERALRKGLASLGERLVHSESAYIEAGTTLRRSIERLGAAVVEADARMADQIPVSPLEGCVAFAPTADGYRLIELPGEPPEVGAMVELEACQGQLVVTRYGRSPLPFDGRPCAYLVRA